MAGLTLVGTVLAYQLWRARAEVPFDLRGDARFNLMTVRNLVEQGWFQGSDRLGAPFGLDLHDFPLGGSNLQFALLWLLALAGGSAGAVMNAYLVVTFVAVAVTAGFVFRWLGLSEPVAAVFAVVYTFLPYHFYRGEHHLFLSAYWAIPLAVYLALSIAQDQPLFERVSRRTGVTLAVCAVIGSTDPYYAAYAILLVLVAGGLLALRSRTLRAAVPAVAVTVVITAVLVVNVSPSLVHRQRHGPNPAAAERFPVESEVYGLKPAALVLPRSDHRLPGLGNLAERYADESPIPSEGGQALGLLGVVGLVWLLLVAAAAMVGSPFTVRRPALHINLAVLAVACLLVGTVGGGSILIGYFITPQFRSWARLSVVIAFLALAAAGHLVDGWRDRRLGGHSSRMTSAVLAALLVVALLDQTSGADVPPYGRNAAEWATHRAFVTGIERRLPAGALVFQLPVVPFPESPRLARMKDYDQFFGYFHSRRLRWSYGGIKGREADWQRALGGQPTRLLLDRLAAVGFAGLTVDRFGYADGAAKLEAELGGLAGPPAVSGNGRLSFFDLTGYREGVRRGHPDAGVEALAAATLRPVLWDPGPGFDFTRADGTSFWVTASGPDASFVLHNPGTAPQFVVFAATLESGGGGNLTIRPPSGPSESVSVPCSRAPLRREFSVPPGSSELRLSADVSPLPAELGPERGAARFRLLSPAVWHAVPGWDRADGVAPSAPC